MSGFRVIDNTRSCLCNPCWAAKCDCGAWLTKHAFTEEDAAREAQWVLDQGPDYHFAHVCPRTELGEFRNSVQLQLELA